MAYSLPNDFVQKYHLENLPNELRNFESGIVESDSLETIRQKMILTREKFSSIQGSISDFRNLSLWGHFFNWQVVQRLSPAKYEQFRQYNNSVVQSKTGGITDDFTSFVDDNNIIELGAVAIAGAVAVAAVPAIAITAPTIPTATTVTLPSLGQASAAVGAAVLDQAKKQAEQEIKNILAPNQIKPISDAEVASEQFVNETNQKSLGLPLLAGLVGLVALIFI